MKYTKFYTYLQNLWSPSQMSSSKLHDDNDPNMKTDLETFT